MAKFGTTKAGHIMPQHSNVRSHFSRCRFERSWHAHSHCAQPPPGNSSNQPKARGNNNHCSWSGLVLVPQSANLYQISQWHFRMGAKFSLHQISPFKASHVPNRPPPPPTPGHGCAAAGHDRVCWPRSGLPSCVWQLFVCSGRVHPGETVASWMVKGLIDFLIDNNNETSKYLRDNFVWKIGMAPLWPRRRGAGRHRSVGPPGRAVGPQGTGAVGHEDVGMGGV